MVCQELEKPFLDLILFKLLRKMDLPILAIPENFQYKKPKKVLFINEIEMIIYKSNMDVLSYVISKFIAQLDVLIMGGKKGNLRCYFKRIKLNLLDNENMSLENAIEFFNSKKEIHLIVKIINVKSFFKRIFSTYIATNITYVSKVQLLFL